MRPGPFPCAAAALWLLACIACSPTFDWREVQPQDTTAVAMFPCRPSQERRDLALSGAPTGMTITACSTGGIMFALASADVAEPARVAPAFDQLRRSALANVGGVVKRQRAVQVPGMTPHPAAAVLEVEGRLPDGRRVEERLAFFSKGTRVYQATVFGPALPPEAVETFLGGLRLP